MVAESEDPPPPPPQPPSRDVQFARKDWISLEEAAAVLGITKEAILIDVEQRKLLAGKLLPVIRDGKLALDEKGRKVWQMHFRRMSFELYAAQWNRAR